MGQFSFYEPEWKLGRTYRMTVLRLFEDGVSFRGGLAIVWGEANTYGVLRGADGPLQVPLTRHPAVVELPNIWTQKVQDVWDWFPSSAYDQVWSFEDAVVERSEDDDTRAWWGPWLPARGNLLIQMFRSRYPRAISPRVKELAESIRSQCFELLGKHGMTPPAWFKYAEVPSFYVKLTGDQRGEKTLPCPRCGGTGNIGFISSVRCPEC